MARLIRCAVALALLLPPVAAGAQVSLGVTGGTLGVGPEVGVRLNETFGLRGNATLLGLDADFNSDAIDYDGNLRLRSAGAMLDLYPFGGGFRVSGGARWNGNRGRLAATPTGPVSIGGITAQPAQVGTLSGRARVRRFAPAATLGYGGTARGGFLFGVEAGALFQDSVRIRDFRSSAGLIPAAALESERQSLQDDVDDYKIYPIVQLILGWRF